MFIEPTMTLTFMNPIMSKDSGVYPGNNLINFVSPAVLYPIEYLQDVDGDSENDDDDSSTVDSTGTTTSGDEMEETVYPPHYQLQQTYCAFTYPHPHAHPIAPESLPAAESSQPSKSDVNGTLDHVIPKKPKRKRAPRRNRKRRPLTPEARERRNRRRRVNYFPRLLKSDIRRNYAQMFTNVMNAYDGTLLRHFMMDYCVPTVQLLDFAPENIPYGLPPLVHQIGMKNILKYWASNSVIIPDFVCQTQSVKLCVDPNTNRSRLVCKTLFQGTKVLDIALGEVDRQISRVLQEAKSALVLDTSLIPVLRRSVGRNAVVRKPNLDASSDSVSTEGQTSESSEGVSIMESVCDSTEGNGHSLVPIHDTNKSKELKKLLQKRNSNESSLFRSHQLPKPLNPPISILYEGSIILYLDETFRIYRFDFLGSQVHNL